MLTALQSCVLPPPPPTKTTAGTPLAVDRQKVIPLTSGVVTINRGVKKDFDVGSAIVSPSSGELVYVSWWLNFDPNNPQPATSQIDPNNSHLELNGCEAQLSGKDTRTVQLEALVTTASRLITDTLFEDPRVGPNGESVIVVQWTVIVTGGEDGKACK